MLPAASPRWAASMRNPARAAGASTRSANARRVGAMRTSPAVISPPPSDDDLRVKGVGQVRQAQRHPPAELVHDLQRGRIPLCGGGRDMLPADHFGVASGQVDQSRAPPAIAISRPNRPSPLPDANRSQQPCLPHGQRGPCGSTTMWPNSPAYRLEPSISSPRADDPPADPGPEGDHQNLVRTRGLPHGRSAQHGGGGVVADPDRPTGESGGHRIGHRAAGETGQVGREAQPPAGVHQAGHADPDRPGRAVSRPGAGRRRHLLDQTRRRPRGLAWTGSVTTPPSGSRRTASILVPPTSTPTTGRVGMGVATQLPARLTSWRPAGPPVTTATRPPASKSGTATP